MNPKAKTRSARVWTHLSATLRDRLSSYCAASNVTERAVFEAALEQYIRPRPRNRQGRSLKLAVRGGFAEVTAPSAAPAACAVVP
jgi:hypothetical protein